MWCASLLAFTSAFELEILCDEQNVVVGKTVKVRVICYVLFNYYHFKKNAGVRGCIFFVSCVTHFHCF